MKFSQILFKPGQIDTSDTKSTGSKNQTNQNTQPINQRTVLYEMKLTVGRVHLIRNSDLIISIVNIYQLS